MKQISKPPQDNPASALAKAFPAAPATDRLAKLQIDAHPSLTNITTPGRNPLNGLFNKFATAFHDLGYDTPHVDMEQEWMRDSDGWNKSLRARFEVQKYGRTIAAVELRSSLSECDLVMVCHSSTADPAGLSIVKSVIGAVTAPSA